MKTDTPDTQARLIIESIRENGSKFRPSDWAERLSASTAQFGPDKKLRYASGVYPGMINNCKCLIVETASIDQQSMAYQRIIEFARTNNLRMYTI
ncbi:MAG: DUF3579 domain-containing protein [Gammaproteobacteria bacterium]|nr:DUF3579 domain-containing protein [Gammaproteobacteria bacterium]